LGEKIRRFIEKKVEELEQEKVLEEVERFIQKLSELPEGVVSKLVSEDRDDR